MNFKKTLWRIQISQFSSLASVRRTWYSVRTPFNQQHPSARRELSIRMPFYLKHHPSGRRELSVRTFPRVEKFQTAPACIRLDVSAARPDYSQCSTSFKFFFQSTVMGRSLQPSGQRGFLSRHTYP